MINDEAQKRIERLEVCLLLLVNSLHSSVKTEFGNLQVKVPASTLATIEKIITSIIETKCKE